MRLPLAISALKLPPQQVYRKLIQYELLALSWGFIMIILDVAVNGINMQHILRLSLPTSSGVCWYFSAYMVLLAIAPLLNAGIEKLPKGQYRLIIMFLFIVEFVGGMLFHANGTTFMQLFLLYLLGRYIRIHGVKMLDDKAALLFFLSTLTNMIVVFVCSYWNVGGDSIVKIIESNRNPLVLISAISFFFMFKNFHKHIPLLSYISKLAPYMFSVYICHVCILYIGVIDFMEYVLVSPFVSLIIYSFVTLLVCVALEKLRMVIMDKPIKKISDYINYKFQIS